MQQIRGTMNYLDAVPSPSEGQHWHGAGLLLILPALDFVGDLMFVQLTELSGLDLMSDSHKLLLESILAGCVQHLHLDWCRIRTPSNTQTG